VNETDQCPCSHREGCCSLCPTLRPGRQANHPDTGWGCCGDCRLRLAAIPGEIADAYALLPPLLWPGSTKGGEVRSKDPDPPMPLGDIHDLLADFPYPQGPLRLGRLAEHAGDQVGRLPVRTTLGTWARDWVERRDVGEYGPRDTVLSMCMWLAERTDWACDQHPAVADYAEDMQSLRGLLLALVGRPEPDERPKALPGVPCIRCRHVSLSRDHDGTVRCSWQDCMGVWKPDEYERVSKATANAIRRGQIKREDTAS
jgi:hypothetical protein